VAGPDREPDVTAATTPQSPAEATTVGVPASAGPPRVIGLDLSLTSTGIASNLGWVERFRPHSSVTWVSPFTRARLIRATVLDYARHADIVVVEGLSVGSTTGRHLDRAGMWHIVMEAVDGDCVPWTQVPPATLKRYATGRGNAGKDEVLAAVIRRFPDVPVAGNDEADALVLAAMGADHLGHPMVAMPQAHRAALAGVVWPEMVRADGAA
jgi:crossover junction endodeoxyribonuclease RuvC